MARLKENSLLNALQGALGKEIVFKQYADKVVVTVYPRVSKKKASERQKLQRAKISEANAYASRAKRDPQLRAEYEKKLGPGESVFHKAKKEFFDRGKMRDE